jgi:hypothetical protein
VVKTITEHTREGKTNEFIKSTKKYKLNIKIIF